MQINRHAVLFCLLFTHQPDARFHMMCKRKLIEQGASFDLMSLT